MARSGGRLAGCRLGVALLTFGLLTAGLPAGASALTVSDLGPAYNVSTGTGLYWTALNDAGQVGGSEPASPGKYQAARWVSGTTSALGTLGTYSSGGAGIANDGTVLGYRGDDLGSGLAIYPTLWDLAGGQQELSAYPGGEQGGFLAAAKNGAAILFDEVAGMTSQYAVSSPPYTSVTKMPGLTAVGVNNAGHAIGRINGSSSTPGFWTGSATAALQVTLNGTRGLNDLDQVAGNAIASGQAAVEQAPGGAVQMLPELAGAAAGDFKPQAINDAGVVVGNTASGAAIHTPGSPTQPLDTLLPTGSPWHLVTAIDINARGDVLGTGTLNGQSRWYLLASPGQQVSGKVYGLSCDDASCSQAGLSGIRVLVTGKATDGSPVSLTDVSKPDGSWSVTAPAGTYAAGPTADGSTFVGPAFDPGHQAVTVAAADVPGVDFKACAAPTTGSRALRATGAVRGAPAPSATSPCKSLYSLKLSARIPQHQLVDPAADAAYDTSTKKGKPAYTDATGKIALALRGKGLDSLLEVYPEYPECFSKHELEEMADQHVQLKWYTYLTGPASLGTVTVPISWNQKTKQVNFDGAPSSTTGSMTRVWQYVEYRHAHTPRSRKCHVDSPIAPVYYVVPGAADLTGQVAPDAFTIIALWYVPFDPAGTVIPPGTSVQHFLEEHLGEHLGEQIVEGWEKIPYPFRFAMTYGLYSGAVKLVGAGAAAVAHVGKVLKAPGTVIDALAHAESVAEALHAAHTRFELYHSGVPAVAGIANLLAKDRYPLMGAVIRGRFHVAKYTVNASNSEEVPNETTLAMSVKSTQFPDISLDVTRKASSNSDYQVFEGVLPWKSGYVNSSTPQTFNPFDRNPVSLLASTANKSYARGRAAHTALRQDMSQLSAISADIKRNSDLLTGFTQEQSLVPAPACDSNAVPLRPTAHPNDTICWLFQDGRG